MLCFRYPFVSYKIIMFSYLFIILILSGCQSLHDDYQVVDLKQDLDYQIPILSLKINGKDTPAYFDSGGCFNASIDEEILKREGKSLDSTGRFIDSAGQVNINKQYLVDLKIGKISFGQVKVEVFQPWGLYLGENPGDSLHLQKVYVGIGLFKSHNILLDIGSKKMIIYNKRYSIPDGKGWEILPLNITENGPEFCLNLGNRSLTTLIDSGANVSTVSMTRPITTKIKKEGDVIELTGLRLERLALKSLCVTVLNSSEPSVDLVLGCDFLKRHQVFFDLYNKRIWIREN